MQITEEGDENQTETKENEALCINLLETNTSFAHENSENTQGMTAYMCIKRIQDVAHNKIDAKKEWYHSPGRNPKNWNPYNKQNRRIYRRREDISEMVMWLTSVPVK